jgi:hypothetical protein
MKQKTALLAGLFICLLLSSCGRVKISRILSDPSHFKLRTINVNGTVTNPSAAPGGVYEVSDGTGSICVLARGGVPSKGARIRVTGKVVEDLSLMGRSFDAIIREREHRPL